MPAPTTVSTGNGAAKAKKPRKKRVDVSRFPVSANFGITVSTEGRGGAVAAHPLVGKAGVSPFPLLPYLKLRYEGLLYGCIET
jgi:hypothetical protein